MMNNDESSAVCDHGIEPDFSEPATSKKTNFGSTTAPAPLRADPPAFKTVGAADLATVGRVAVAGTAGPLVVRTAAELAQMQGPSVTTPTILRRKFLRDGDRMIVRPISNDVVQVGIHYRMATSDGSNQHLRCNGTSCVLCVGGFKPANTGLLVIFSVDDRDLAVITFDLPGGPGALAGQLVPILVKDNFLLHVLDIAKFGNRFEVTVMKVIDLAAPDHDPHTFGDAVLRDLAARSALPTPEQIASTVEAWPNQRIVREMPQVVQRIKLYRPDVDVSKL